MRHASGAWIEPYDFWASGDPIPMGYRDQNGNVHGPFALDHGFILYEWEERDGEPGSPLNDDYAGLAVGRDAQGATLYEQVQSFEHGSIVYDSYSVDTTYYPYNETYLPDIRAHTQMAGSNSTNSTIIVRNDHSSVPATVSISIYTRDGRVLDSRTHASLPAQRTWIFPVRATLYYDFLQQQYYDGELEGAATVYANQNVSVSVMNIHQGSSYSAGSYAGQSQTGSTLYAPLLMRNNNGWQSDLTVFNTGTSSAQVTVQYVPISGGGTGCTMSTPRTIAPHGSYRFNLKTDAGCTLSSPFVGGARVTNSSTNQPLVAVANQWQDSDNNNIAESFMSYEAFPEGHTSSFQPLLMRDNNTWHAGVSFQDTASNDQDVTALYYPLDSGTSCGSNLIGMATNGVVIRNPLPPSGQCGWSPTTFVGSGWAMRGSDFAAVVNQATTANLNTMSYSAVRQGATTGMPVWPCRTWEVARPRSTSSTTTPMAPSVGQNRLARCRPRLLASTTRRRPMPGLPVSRARPW